MEEAYSLIVTNKVANADDLQTFCSAQGFELTTAQATALVSRFDSRGNSKIDKKEFEEFINSKKVETAIPASLSPYRRYIGEVPHVNPVPGRVPAFAVEPFHLERSHYVRTESP